MAMRGIFLAWLVGNLLWCGPLWAGVEVFGGTGCFEPKAVSSQLEAILAKHAQSSQLQVRLGAHIGETFVGISMRILSSKGRVLIQREYELLPSDCTSVPELLSIVVEEFLREVPVERWSLPPKSQERENAISTPASSGYKMYTASVALGTELPRSHLTGEALIGVKLWKLLPIELGASIASTLPHSIAEGSVVYSAVSAFIGWEHQKPWWKASLRFKGGVLGVWGQNLPNQKSHYLGWAQVELGAGLIGQGWNLVFKGSYSPISYRLETLDAKHHIEVPAVRALVGVEIPFGAPYE